MKEEMTINKFLVQLRKKRGLGWSVGAYGRIRTKVGMCCPITAIYDESPSNCYMDAAHSLGIRVGNVRAITYASDRDDDRCYKLRKRILKAVGLEG